MKSSTLHRAQYSAIYRVNGRITFDYPETAGDFDIAAIKTIYNGENLVSRDMVVKEGCWVDSREADAFEKAIALRNKS